MIDEKKRAFKSYCTYFYLLLRCVEAAVVVQWYTFFSGLFLGGGFYLSIPTYTYKDNGENS